MLRMCKGKETLFLKLKVKLPNSLHTCAQISELPSNKSTNALHTLFSLSLYIYMYIQIINIFSILSFSLNVKHAFLSLYDNRRRDVV